MTTAGLILRGVLCNKPRFAFTIGSIATGFVLLGLMLPVYRMFNSRIDFADANRLIVINKSSMMRPLPINYGERIAKVPDIKLVSHFTFFGGVYRDESNPVAAIVTEPAKFADMVAEVEFREPEAQRRWLKEPSGIAVGRQLADRLGWKNGDLVPVHSTIYPQRDGSSAWTFRVSAIFDAKKPNGSTNSMVVNYHFFNEERAFGKDMIGWFSVLTADAGNVGATANAIDAMFANSPDETNTVTERAFAQSFLSQVGDFRSMIVIALTLVFWTLILITANTVAQSARERFSEFAVLKTLGFSHGRVTWLVLGESLFLLLAGGVTGLALVAAALPVIVGKTDQLLSLLATEPMDWLVGMALAVSIALLVAIVPALRAARQPITDGLAEAM